MDGFDGLYRPAGIARVHRPIWRDRIHWPARDWTNRGDRCYRSAGNRSNRAAWWSHRGCWRFRSYWLDGLYRSVGGYRKFRSNRTHRVAGAIGLHRFDRPNRSIRCNRSLGFIPHRSDRPPRGTYGQQWPYGQYRLYGRIRHRVNRPARSGWPSRYCWTHRCNRASRGHWTCWFGVGRSRVYCDLWGRGPLVRCLCRLYGVLPRRRRLGCAGRYAVLHRGWSVQGHHDHGCQQHP